MNARWSSRLLWLVLGSYVLLALAYGAINPLFEAPDEQWHYFTVQFIADERRLPFVAAGDDYDRFLSQEAAQPPLYYALGALLIAPLDTAGARDDLWLNKFAVIGDASALTNINNAIHTDREAWPWRGWVLAAHLLRGFSTLLGLGTLLCIWQVGRLIWPTRPERPLLAVALVAFLPQFAFLHGSVTNDALIIFLASLGLWQVVRIWLHGMSTRRGLLLGLTCGLAILTKNAGALLLVYALGVVALTAVRDRAGWRRAVGWLATLGVTAVVVGGWLWLRNWQLYGDPTATEPFIRIAGGDRGYTLGQALGEWRGLWLSIFAVFGWFNVRPPVWVYGFWNGVALLAAVGGVWRILQRRSAGAQREDEAASRLSRWLAQRWALGAALAGWVLAVAAGLVLFMLRTEAAQGRLLFPALLPLALGAAFGLSAFRRLSTAVVPAVAVVPVVAVVPAAAAVSLFCLLAVIRPAYARPPLVAAAPPEAALAAGLGQGVAFVGAQMPPAVVRPGDAITLTLYWRGADVTAEPVPEQVISVFGRDVVEIGKLHSYHGRGLYPATLWPETAVVADTFGLWLADDAVTPVLARVDVSLNDGTGSVQAGDVKVVPAQWPEAAGPDLATLGEVTAVTRVEVAPQQARSGETLAVTVQWRALAATGVDHTTLLHLGEPDQPPLAVGDRPPLNGDYPTRAWAPGEVIDDWYTLAIPDGLAPGRYPVWLGMYDSETLTRLPLSAAGEPQPFNVYPAGWVEVVPEP